MFAFRCVKCLNKQRVKMCFSGENPSTSEKENSLKTPILPSLGLIRRIHLNNISFANL